MDDRQWSDYVDRTVRIEIEPRLFAMPCLMRVSEVRLPSGAPGHMLFRCGCLLVTVSGRGRLKMDGREYLMTSGTACMADPECSGSVYWSTADPGEVWHFYEILFAAGSAGFLPQMTEMYGVVVTLHELAAVSGVLDGFLSGRRQCAGVSNFRALAYWTELLCLIYDGLSPDSRGVSRSELAEMAHRRIDGAFAEIVSVSSLATGFGVSRGHLAKVFTAEFGIGVHEYLAQVRVGKAATLLHNTNLSSKEIAAEVGFSCRSVFFRNFRRFFQCTPEEFRREMALPSGVPQAMVSRREKNACVAASSRQGQ